ncbi:MAG: hypothetical protein ISS72_08920 [Candidatus Brocadiae bacterium]|nr:hypothetical protein [Candidatus Brocadiia bacterium]
MADEAPRPTRRFPIWETAAILAAIASLWPAYILQWDEPWWKWLSYAMLALMFVVFVRRMVAFNRLAREAEERKRKEQEQGGRARLPWEPPAQGGA